MSVYSSQDDIQEIKVHPRRSMFEVLSSTLRELVAEARESEQDNPDPSGSKLRRWERYEERGRRQQEVEENQNSTNITFS